MWFTLITPLRKCTHGKRTTPICRRTRRETAAESSSGQRAVRTPHVASEVLRTDTRGSALLPVSTAVLPRALSIRTGQRRGKDPKRLFREADCCRPTKPRGNGASRAHGEGRNCCPPGTWLRKRVGNQ